MANNYIAKIRAELDSASLQEQIDKIVKKSGTIKVKVETDGDLSAFVKDVSKKVEAAGNVTIKPKVDTAELDSGMGTLSRTITRIVNDSTTSVESIYKSVGDGFDKTVSQIDGKTKKITQNYESYTKRVLSEEQKMQEALASTLKKRREEEEKTQRAQASAINKSQEESYREINSELEKASSLIEKLTQNTSERAKLEERLKKLSSSDVSEETLEHSKKLVSDIRERISAEESERKIAASISSELEKASSYISKMKEGTESRLMLERELSRISSQGASEETLQRAEEFSRWAEERLAKEKEEIAVSSKINTELNKALSYIVKMQEGTDERVALEKKLEEISSKRPTQDSLEEARKLTRETEIQLSYEKNRLSISEQISKELERASESISKIPSGYYALPGLKEKYESIQTAPDTKENLEAARQLVQETQEQLQYSTKLLELEKRQRQEKEKIAREQANAINKNAREELAIREKVNEQLKEIRTRIEAVKMSSSQRLEIEKKIEDAMAMENSKDRLSALKNINTEIAAMGKNAMSLGAMLQTAYEKFANKLRLCTEMCIEKQCVYAGKS